MHVAGEVGNYASWGWTVQKEDALLENWAAFCRQRCTMEKLQSRGTRSELSDTVNFILFFHL